MNRQISRITIEGYKSIRQLRDFELRPLTILIGANGAGKSNFVSFFTLLHEMVEQRLRVEVQKRGGADALLYMGPKTTERIVGKLHFGQNDYEFVLVPTPGNHLVLAEETTAYTGGKYGDSRKTLSGTAESQLKDLKDRPGVLGAPRGVAGYIYDALSSWVVYHFHDTTDTAAVRRQGSVRDNEYLRSDASNLAAFLMKLRATKSDRYDMIRDAIRLVAPFFDDFVLRPQRLGGDDAVMLEWSQKESDYPFHPSQISDGTLRFMCLATALLQPHPPATVLLDEPELGLHPYALSLLASLLKQARNRTQVIVSTQSAVLLNHFEPADIVVVDREDGASQFRRLDSAELAEWLQTYTLGELWEKNVFDGGPVHE